MDVPEFSDFKLDHIGIAVHSLEEGSKLYRAMGFDQMYIEEVPSEGVRVGMYALANGARIELIEPTGPETPVAKFLSKKGPGIHHYCLNVEDIGAVMASLKEKGLRLINQEPVPGAHNCLVAFIHPSSAGGVLVELSQKQ